MAHRFWIFADKRDETTVSGRSEEQYQTHRYKVHSPATTLTGHQTGFGFALINIGNARLFRYDQ
jgi:hypothetical protein